MATNQPYADTLDTLFIYPVDNRVTTIVWHDAEQSIPRPGHRRPEVDQRNPTARKTLTRSISIYLVEIATPWKLHAFLYQSLRLLAQTTLAVLSQTFLRLSSGRSCSPTQASWFSVRRPVLVAFETPPRCSHVVETESEKVRALTISHRHWLVARSRRCSLLARR